MSTICYRDGIMASDTRGFSGDKVPIGNKRKIATLPDGTLIGISSSVVGEPTKLIADLTEFGFRMVLDDKWSVSALVVRPDGSVYYLDDGDSFSGPLEADYWAIGSGEEFAIGALHMGATAAQAVQVAIDVDPWTGGQVDTVKLQKAKTRKRAAA